MNAEPRERVAALTESKVMEAEFSLHPQWMMILLRMIIREEGERKTLMPGLH